MDKRLLEHLAKLVSFDTRNPPRNIDGNSPVIQYCREILEQSFEITVADHGDGHVSFLAVRGQPDVLFNVHLDTVPHSDDWQDEGWSIDPLQLQVRNGKAFGRGACDIKGAAAVLLSIAERKPDHCALLFTTDEEGSAGCCVRNFIEAGGAKSFSQVVVAEPTGCSAILGHRGYLSVKGSFSGVPGHSSEARALEENAIHQFARWSGEALTYSRGIKNSEADPGACFNIGLVQGGTKSNVIAGELFVHWSARLKPGQSNTDFYKQVCGNNTSGETAKWHVPFTGEPLPASPELRQIALDFAETNDIPVAEDVDFWTEASIFSEFGLPAMVLGPGHITEAHIVDEWVSLDQLESAAELYSRIISHDQ